MDFELRQPETFCLDDYDVIGLDLDHTLVRYHLKAVSQLVFRVLTKYLVEEKSYPAELGESYDATCDFYLKGILLDKERGNFLRLSRNHVIVKATHGTQLLSGDDVERIYGRKRTWEPTLELPGSLCLPKIVNQPFFLFRDFFVIPIAYIAARAIDLVDHCENKSWSRSYSRIWDDVLEGISAMYQREAFQNGAYFNALCHNPSMYFMKCSEEVLKWLKALGEAKKVFLLTSSHVDCAEMILNYIIGEDWRKYFHIVITYARKPGFFNANRPFLNLNGATESDVATTLEGNKVYSQGNWQQLKAFFGSELNNEPKILYIGDSLPDDVLCPSTYTSCHAVAIVEEMDAEGMKDVPSKHPAREELTSAFWGSFFIDSDSRCPTLLDDTIRSHAKIAVPYLSVLAQLSLTQRIPAFSGGNTLGYYPSVPLQVAYRGKYM